MPRQWEHEVVVGKADRAVTVGYSTKMRSDSDAYYVVFLDPAGRKLERITKCKRTDVNFHASASRIIADAYSSHVAAVEPAVLTFDVALSELAKAHDLRDGTRLAYSKSLHTLMLTAPKLTGPKDVTPEVATRFGMDFLSTPYKRAKASDAKTYMRVPTTLAFHHRQLSALWEQLGKLGHVEGNPWKTVRKTAVDKKRKPVPTEDVVKQFWLWLDGRYPQWQRLRALFELKSVSGCRTDDVCRLKTSQFRDGRVVWTAEQTKQREGRAVLLEPALFDKLKRLAGPVWLWECFPDDVRRFRPSRNKLPAAFTPKTVYWVMGNVCREFSDRLPAGTPRLSPHAFRRRAITLIATATGSVDATAEAVGLNPATARGYYLDAKRAFNSDDVFRKTASVLMPPPQESPSKAPLPPNSGE